MAYTPELSYRGSATLRRLAWFRGKPMTNTLEALLEATGRTTVRKRFKGFRSHKYRFSECAEYHWYPSGMASFCFWV